MKKRQKLFSLTMAALLMVSLFAGCKSKDDLPQFDDPKKGQTMATIKVKDYGDIELMLFPDVAPKGVENFVTHARDGYYDGVVFHRVVSDFMIQGGDPDGTGMGGESIWGDGFGVEYDGTLRNFSGAIAYAHSALPDSNGSQFFIVKGAPVTDEYMEMVKANYPDVAFSDAVIEKYKEVGGSPFLDGEYTVFGQVVKGLDIVQKIMEVETAMGTDGAMSAPVEPVVIETITISEYEG